MADDNVPAPYPNSPSTIQPLTPELSPAHSQTTHPSTASHDEGDQGRPAISGHPDRSGS